MKSNLYERMKFVSYKANIPFSSISENLGVTTPALISRLKHDKMTVEEKGNIARMFGCKYIPVFQFGRKKISGKTVAEMVSLACEYKGISQAELAERFGRTRQSLNSQINRGKLTEAGMNDLAEKLGCSYIDYFEFPDGTRI